MAVILQRLKGGLNTFPTTVSHMKNLDPGNMTELPSSNQKGPKAKDDKCNTEGDVMQRFSVYWKAFSPTSMCTSSLIQKRPIYFLELTERVMYRDWLGQKLNLSIMMREL